MREGKMVSLKRDSHCFRFYPSTMHGMMLLGKKVGLLRFEVLCGDNQIRIVRVTDLEAI